MLTFTHTLRSSMPLLFGPAGQMATIAECYPDTTGTLKMGNRSADLSRPMKLAALGIRKGDAVTVCVDGPSEVEMFDVLCTYFDTAM